MVYFSSSSFNTWRDNGFPSVLYIKGPAFQTYVIGEFLTGAADPKPEGYVTDDGWLSLGSTDGNFSSFETSPTFGGAFDAGHMTSVPAPEFTVVDTNVGFIVHILAGVGRGFGDPDPSPAASGSLALAISQYKSPQFPAQATLDMGQLPGHSQYRICTPVIDEDPTSLTYGAILGFEQEEGALPGFGQTSASLFGGVYRVDSVPLVSFGSRDHPVQGSAGLAQNQIVQVGPRSTDCGDIQPPPAFVYQFSATLHYGEIPIGQVPQCGNSPGECNADALCGCPDCVVQGPPCGPVGGLPGLPACDFVIANGRQLVVQMESDALDICTAYRDDLPSGSPTNLPYLGDSFPTVGVNISYAETGYCPRRMFLETTAQIGFSTMGITF
tara:strand:+ start:3174 stop:4322 length:1149 start_codon:yes stop_codon:yes gene_type:complete